MDRLGLSELFLHFLVLWFVAVGGPSTILPDIHRYVVEGLDAAVEGVHPV